MFYFYVVYLLAFVISLSLAVYMLGLLYSAFHGAPYVPTSQKNVKEILLKAGVQRGDRIIEFGSGDGRFLITAARQFKVTGTGLEINPVLCLYSRILARLNGIKTVKFYRTNFFEYNVSQADIIYFFLLPKMIVEVQKKLLKECPKNTKIISHGFKLPGWEDKCTAVLTDKPFPTYFYKL